MDKNFYYGVSQSVLGLVVVLASIFYLFRQASRRELRLFAKIMIYLSGRILFFELEITSSWILGRLHFSLPWVGNDHMLLAYFMGWMTISLLVVPFDKARGIRQVGWYAVFTIASLTAWNLSALAARQ